MGGRSRSRERQYSSHRTGQYLSHERFDKGDSRVAWDKDRRGDKYDHRGYQEKYKKGERVERDHYRR